MGNTWAGRLVLLGAAAGMLAAPFGVAAADAAAGSHSAAATTDDIQGHDRIGSEPIAHRPAIHLLSPPDGATSPSQYAQIAFDAWVRADHTELRGRGTRTVADMLIARPWSWDDEWDEQKDCDDAAGSTHCTWTGRSAQLTLRIANEQAANGETHAVTKAVLEPVPGPTVALWPLTTKEQAGNTQEQVDEGHSPWLLYPDTVATLYAEVELGWNNPRVSAVGSSVFRVTDPTAGAVVEMTLGQPARTGANGIWALTSLRSIAGG